MTVFPTKTLLLISALLCLPVAGPAQRTISQPPQGTLQQIPPTLPPSESKSGAFDQPIGNTWLGGTVHVDASMTRQSQAMVNGVLVSSPRATQHLAMRNVANLLGWSREVFDFLGDATNSIPSVAQIRSGQVRMAFAGNIVINQSFTSGFTLPSATTNFNLFAGHVSGNAPLVKNTSYGTLTVSLEGNVACTHIGDTNWSLPAGYATATETTAAVVNANADVWIGAGISRVTNPSVTFVGRIFTQRVDANPTASALYGLSGSVSFLEFFPPQVALTVSGTYVIARYTVKLTNAAQYGPLSLLLM